jgi:hypothetical protein
MRLKMCLPFADQLFDANRFTCITLHSQACQEKIHLDATVKALKEKRQLMEQHYVQLNNHAQTEFNSNIKLLLIFVDELIVLFPLLSNT